jgi:hypothetical protein
MPPRYLAYPCVLPVGVVLHGTVQVQYGTVLVLTIHRYVGSPPVQYVLRTPEPAIRTRWIRHDCTVCPLSSNKVVQNWTQYTVGSTGSLGYCSHVR